MPESTPRVGRHRDRGDVVLLAQEARLGGVGVVGARTRQHFNACGVDGQVFNMQSNGHHVTISLR